jgi:hypothetical protein
MLAKAGIQESIIWIPASAEILLRVIILQLVRFHSVNRDEVITIRAILHDGALPLPAAGRRKQ